MKSGRRILRVSAWIIGVILLILSAFILIPEKETVPPLQPRASTKYWQMSRGFRIAYSHFKGGESVSRTPIVYLHGGPGAYVHSSTVEIMKKLSHAGHEIYLYDQAGSGLSDRLPRYSDISFYTHLQDLHEIITNHIKARKVILIGHSFGSLLAAHFSSSYPELIEKIIFTSPGQLQPLESDSSDGAGLSRKYPTPDSLHYLEPYSFVGDVDRTALTPKAILATTGALLFDVKLVSDEDMDRMLNTLIAKAAKGAVCDTTNPIPPEGGMGLYSYIATNNYSEVKDVRDKIRQLDIPILVIQGQCDFMPFAAAYEYVDLYKDGTFVFIENAGHIIWWEQPTKFLEVITGFLANR